MKIVINSDFGGFGLSDEAFERYLELKEIEYVKEKSTYFSEYYIKGSPGNPDQYLSAHDIKRDDPCLIQVVEELGNKANYTYSCLKIVEIPDDVEWVLQDYDGMEHIAEKHRTWS